MLFLQPRQRSKVGACPVGNLGTAQRLGNALRVLIAGDANDAALANRRRFDDLRVAMFMIAACWLIVLAFDGVGHRNNT